MPGSSSHYEIMSNWMRTAIAAVMLVALPLMAEDASDEAATRPAAKTILHLPLTNGKYAHGALVSADEENVVLRVGDRTRTIPVEEIKPAGIYIVKKGLADLTKASVRMELGRFLLEHGEIALAQRELNEAVRLDPGLAERVKDLLKSAAESAKADRARKDEDESEEDVRQKAGKYGKPTPEEIEANHRWARELAEKAQAVGPALHLVETEHFLIFSSWPRSRDKALGGLCEKMYRTYCAQFDIRGDESVFVGKCPVFLFWEKEQFRRFATDIDKTNLGGAAGYVAYRDGRYCHIVMSGIRAYDKFCEIIVHEGTHAFMSRYLSGRPIPQWANEGLAEYMAAKVVRRTWAAKRHKRALQDALRNKKDVSYIFERFEANDFDYGIAHSIVRFMIDTNRPGFARFITLIKEGSSEEEALKESFDCTHEELVGLWRRAAARRRGT